MKIATSKQPVRMSCDFLSFLYLLLIPNNLTFYQCPSPISLFPSFSSEVHSWYDNFFYPLPLSHSQLSLLSNSSSRSLYWSNQSMCQPTFIVKLQALLSWSVVTQGFQGQQPLAGVPDRSEFVCLLYLLPVGQNTYPSLCFFV